MRLCYIGGRSLEEATETEFSDCSLNGGYFFTMMEVPFPDITLIIFIEESIDVAIKSSLQTYPHHPASVT